MRPSRIVARGGSVGENAAKSAAPSTVPRTVARLGAGHDGASR